MFLVNWPAADCSGEIAVGLKYTCSSHTARRLRLSARSPVSFCFHSSLRLRRPGLNTSVFLTCIRLNYAVCGVPPVHSCVSAARFLFFSHCESIDARGCNSILSYWDLGNSLILLPSPKHIFEQNPIKPVGFMNPDSFFFFFF